MQTKTQSAPTAQPHSHVGIATIVIVIGLVIVLVVAGTAGYYVLVVNAPGSTHSRSSSSTSASSSSIASSTTFAAGVKTYKGTYSYTVPLGPGGERVSSNGTVEVYNSVQVAAGSFTFSINPANYTGTGSGQGTITVTTTGFCTGQSVLPYTFKIPNANDLLHGNITVSFSDNNPPNATVKLTCTGDMSNVSSTNNPITFLPVYPNLVSVAAVPATISQTLSGGISYQITITATN